MATAGNTAAFKLSWFDRLSISNEERQAFLENFGVMLGSGIAISDILFSIKDSQKSPGMQKITAAMQQGIENGYSISKVFELSELFPPHVVNLVSLGEESGTLAKSFVMLSESEAQAAEFRSKVRSAMLYPVIVIVIALIVGIGVAWFILPKLATVFSSLNLKLPLVTKVFIGIGIFLSKYGIVAVPVFFLLLGVVLYGLFFYRKTKHIGETILLHVPGVGAILKETEIARMGTLMGTLFSSGMPVALSLHALTESATIARYRKFYQYLEKKVTEGNSFESSFRSYPKSTVLVPAQVQALIFSGEKTGTLATIFQKIGITYSTKSELAAKNLAVVIEPILLIFIAGGVMLIALAVILPIYKLVGGING